MNKGAPAARLVEEQLTAFQENFGAEYAKRAKALGLTPYELLIVASMIEREAQLPSDRAKVAAVIYNRLKAGIPLGIDATIYYAVESAKNIPTYTKRTDRIAAACRLAVQHAHSQRAAADADLEPRRRLDPGGRAPGPRLLPVLRGRRRRLRRAEVRDHRSQVPGRRRRPTKRPSVETAVTCRPASTADAAARRARVAGRPQPLARDAERRARGARARRLALPAPAGAAGAVRRDRPRARRRRVRRRQRHDPAQGGGARAGRRGERRGARRSARPTR